MGEWQTMAHNNINLPFLMGDMQQCIMLVLEGHNPQRSAFNTKWNEYMNVKTALF